MLSLGTKIQTAELRNQRRKLKLASPLRGPILYSSTTLNNPYITANGNDAITPVIVYCTNRHDALFID